MLKFLTTGTKYVDVQYTYTGVEPNMTVTSTRADTEDLDLDGETNDYISDSVCFTVLEVIIKQGGVDITDTTQDVIVGEKISLVGDLLPDDVVFMPEDIISTIWTIPEKRIKDYVADKDFAKAYELEEGDLDDSSVDFYWVDGADNRDVSYTFTINGKDFIADATFDVKRPDALIDTELGDVDVGTTFGYWALSFGKKEIKPGIEFTKTVNVPAGFAGDTQWVQVVDDTTRRFRVESTGDWYRFEKFNACDTVYPYPPVTDLTTNDSPLIGLEGQDLYGNPVDLDGATMDDNFTMYLMFKPDGVGNIWVPLRRVSWGWTGECLKAGSTWNGTDLVDDDKWANNDVDCIHHPQWIQNIEPVEWIKEP